MGADPRRWRTLAVTQLAAFMVLLDASGRTHGAGRSTNYPDDPVHGSSGEIAAHLTVREPGLL
ncbi:MAG: hypothetical protein J2P20_10820 [Pseudonocardia sp.]|nr:hypothetical protein [Pseudonocardia sp.]MBO0874074.1 hypothetical protein [Pseudonocardia sp.]